MSTAAMKLYSYPGNYRVDKTLVVAQYNGVDIEMPPIDLMAGAHKTEEFLAKNPVGKVPVLETPSGCLFESGAIARYVARLRPDTKLLGATEFQQALVDQWIDFCSFELEKPRTVWVVPIYGFLPYDDKANADAKKEVANALSVLDKHLLANKFMVGDAVTLADITIVTALVDLFRLVMTPDYIVPFPNLVRWFNVCVALPEFAKVIGKVEFAKEEAKPMSKAYRPEADKPKESQ